MNLGVFSTSTATFTAQSGTTYSAEDNTKRLDALLKERLSPEEIKDFAIAALASEGIETKETTTPVNLSPPRKTVLHSIVPIGSAYKDIIELRSINLTFMYLTNVNHCSSKSTLSNIVQIRPSLPSYFM